MGEHFEIAASFGFDELEFGIGGGHAGRLSDEPSAAEITAFRGLAKSYGIVPSRCCIENDFTLLEKGAHRRAVEKAIDQSRAAAECGAEQVRFFAGFTPYAAMSDAVWKQLVEALVACDRILETLGLSMAIETHGAIQPNRDGSLTHVHSVTTHRDGLARLLQEIPTRIGFNYDPGNIRAVEPDDSRYAVDLLAGRITYCHLKDWARCGAGWTAVAIGDVVDGIDWVDLLGKTQFQGTHLIEYEPIDDTREGIARSLAFLTSIGFTLHSKTGSALCVCN